MGHILLIFFSVLLVLLYIHLLQNVWPHFNINGACVDKSNIILHISHLIKSSIRDLSKELKEKPVESVLLFVFMCVFSWLSIILYLFDEILFYNYFL